MDRSSRPRLGFRTDRLVFGVAAGACFCLFWAAQAAADPAESAALVKAAKAEGEIAFYYTVTENVGKRISDAFTAKYGIKVERIRMKSLQVRYASEMQAGSVAADLVIEASNSFAFAQDGIAKGWITPIPDADLPVVKSGVFPAKFNRGATAVIQIAPWMIAYNSDKVKPDDAPKDWPDVLKPKFKGQVILPDPASAATYLDLFGLLRSRYGVAFFDGLRAQSPRIYSSGVPAVQALAAGEGSVVVPVVQEAVRDLQDKGAPVATAMPGVTTAIEVQLYLTNLAKSKHPNAARLFADYVMSPEGNAIFNASPGTVSVYQPPDPAKTYESPAGDYSAAKLKQIAALLGQDAK